MTSLNTRIVPFSNNKPSAQLHRRYRSHDPFERLLDNFFHTGLMNLEAPSENAGDLRVALEVGETDKAYHIAVDLPGIDEKDVELTLSEGVLTISGERVQEEASEDKNIYRNERRYGMFKRSLALPSDVNEKKISASMKHGVLTVDIEKMPEEKPQSKRIPIKS